MMCYVHSVGGREVQAVAICKNCGVAMCLEHLRDFQAHRPGGVEYGCNHVLPLPQAAR